MEYLNYVRFADQWYPPIEANVREIVFMIVAAGRNDIRFRLGHSMPYTYSLYKRAETRYQHLRGLCDHVHHYFTDEEYARVAEELKVVLANDPCDRRYMESKQS
jgi:hypothetical protein